MPCDTHITLLESDSGLSAHSLLNDFMWVGGLVSNHWSFISCHLLYEHTDHKHQGQASDHQGTGGLQGAGDGGPLQFSFPTRNKAVTCCCQGQIVSL